MVTNLVTEENMIQNALRNAHRIKDEFMIEIIEDYSRNISKKPIYTFVYSGGKFI